MIDVCGGVGCVGGGAIRSRSVGTAGGYSRGGRWKVSASCAVTRVSTDTTDRSFRPRCLLASVRVPVIATSNRSKGRQPGCPTSQ